MYHGRARSPWYLNTFLRYGVPNQYLVAQKIDDGIEESEAQVTTASRDGISSWSMEDAIDCYSESGSTRR